MSCDPGSGARGVTVVGRRTTRVARRTAIMSRVAHATIPVRVQASARRTELVSVRDGVLVVRVAARAHEGQANTALCRFLADRVGIRASRVGIVRGHRSRDKLIQIEDVDQETAELKLGLSSSR